MKIVKAVAPYQHLGFLNFKQAPYEAWVRMGGKVASSHYPWRFLHGMFYRWELPTLWKNGKEARLRFVEPVSLYFDTFPDYARYEIIPMIWDCWPQYFEKMCTWLKKHDVRTAIFTSCQTAERIRSRFHGMNVMFCPEAVDTTTYIEGKELKDREIDVLEFGRAVFNAGHSFSPNGQEFKYICTKVNGKFTFTEEQLIEAMGDARVAISLPRSLTQPEVAGDIETLTQRYWECMLSRIVMVGHAPRELVDLVGYNPVVEIDTEGNENLNDQLRRTVKDVLAHIEDYQPLVDKNREVALRQGDWGLRMKQVMEWLEEQGYETMRYGN